MREASDEAYDKIMTTNVKSAFWLCNMVAPQMAGRGNGAIIVISSIASLYGNRKLGLYGVSKRSEEHTSELQSLMRISYAVFCLKKKKNTQKNYKTLLYHIRALD